jgi:cupredoxin-like protein
VTDLGTTAPGPAGKSDARWSTGIAVQDDGTVHIAWADTKGNQIVLADGKEGNLEATPVSGSANGTNPSLAASADGKFVAVAWFDSVNANLEVAQTSSGALALAHPLPTLAQPSVAATTPAAACQPDGTTLQISAQNVAFDKNCLAAPAGKAVTIEFNNQDPALPHNVEIFTDSSGTTRLGGATGPDDTVAGPATVTYKVDPLKAGTFFFRCDVHPTTMTGTFVVK